VNLVRGAWKVLVGIKDGLVLIAMLIFFGLLFAVLSAKPGPTSIRDGALLLRLDGRIVEQPTEVDPFSSLTGRGDAGHEFRLRSRWMLVFDSIRYAWRRFQARLHGHEHVDPMEMSSYGMRTAFGVGMIHGIGAETGTQVLLIAAIGGASAEGLGIPMMVAFIVGLLISNSIVVVVTATGFIASRLRERLYVVIGVVAGTFSLVIGAIFLFGLETRLPSIEAWLFGGGS